MIKQNKTYEYTTKPHKTPLNASNNPNIHSCIFINIPTNTNISSSRGRVEEKKEKHINQMENKTITRPNTAQTSTVGLKSGNTAPNYYNIHPINDMIDGLLVERGIAPSSIVDHSNWHNKFKEYSKKALKNTLRTPKKAEDSRHNGINTGANGDDDEEGGQDGSIERGDNV